ncbi:MAG: glycosyltransferase family 2 protein [Candidatus Dormibacteraeota bacterium]|nr:glycosyltransferase family 2 protein [Candidatus Dormibacteraeota bacterium]
MSEPLTDGSPPADGATEAAALRAEIARLSQELSAQQQLYIQLSETLKRQEEDTRVFRRQLTVRIAEGIAQAVTVTAPPNTARRRWLYAAVQAVGVLRREGPAGLRTAAHERRLGRDAQLVHGVRAQYDAWRGVHEPTAEQLAEMREESRGWTGRPLVSVLVPTYESNPEWLRPALDSVLAQAYENWELCIADDGSRDPAVRTCLEEYTTKDPRVRVVFRPRNGGISAASASALEMATGEFVALLDHDDVLAPHALYRVVKALHSTADADVVYSDEDLLLVDGRRVPGFFKPDWSPELLTSVNYMCHLAVLRTQLVHDVGGFRDGFDGSQDHDLLLRATEKARTVVHIADVLYSWRQVPGSVALHSDSKMYAYQAGRRAVADAVGRRGLTGSVTLGAQLGTYNVRLVVTGSPRVAIVIPTRDRLNLLLACVDSIERRSTYRNWTITIVDNDSSEPATLDYLATTAYTVVRAPGHFNYSHLVNVGRDHVDADYILTVNNDVEVRSPDWIEAMLEQAQRPEVGVVGARLLYPDGRPQHEGIGVGNVGGASTAVNLDAGWLGSVIRDVSAVTGACQMTRLTVFDEVHGYDEKLHVGYNDVDFCLRVRRAGYRIVYTPHAELVHREGSTRGPLSPAADERLFYERWTAAGGLRDPYVNPHVRHLNPLSLRVGAGEHRE